LIEALDQVVRRLGGVTRVWRFDRMATVCYPSSGRITAAFAQVAEHVAKHYGVRSVTCPPRRGNRKGVVEKANHSAAQRWWRTLGDDVTVEQAQAGVDHIAAKLDGRHRVRDGERTTVGELAAAERLRPAPLVAFPTASSTLPAPSARRPWWPSAAMPTRSHPAWPAPRFRSGTGSAPSSCASSPPAARRSRSTTGRRTALVG
jgi:hypothetical protein